MDQKLNPNVCSFQIKVSREHDMEIFQQEESVPHRTAFDETTSYDQKINKLYRSRYPSDGALTVEARTSLRIMSTK